MEIKTTTKSYIDMSFLFYHLVCLPLLSILFWQCMFSSVEAAVEPLNINTDKEALISLRSQISLEPPNPLSSWDINMSPCNWTGVVCSNQRVVGLNLPNLKLVGSISPFIGNLTSLRFLQLQSNQLTGPLPDQIGRLLSLQALNLSFNSFLGSIPKNISKLSELKVIDLMRNKLTGRVPEELSSLPKLQVLNMGRNLLSGPIPPSLANLSSLTELNFGTNFLSGLLPEDLSRLENLKVLDVTINNLTGTVPSSIYNMSSLVTLAVASNKLWGDIPSDVGERLPNLLVFNFCLNKFTGRIPGSLHNLTNIRVIRMAHNLLEGTVPPGLGNLPFLEMYNIGFNKIVNSEGDDNGLEFITSLTNSSRLHFLALDGNQLRGPIPESVGNLSKVLRNLYMGGNQIYGTIPASIGHLSGLTLLNLSNNALSGAIPAEVGQLEELQVLELAGNQISGRIPDSLGNLQKLNQMDLSGNKVDGQIPSTFGNLRNLLSMDLSNNRLNGSIPPEVLNLPTLSTILNLSNNFLSGNLPQEIGLLENVVTIDLSDNWLSGNITSSIKTCTSLEELFMDGNMITGPIPAALGEVKALEIIDLSRNNLSGLIPPDLQQLHALQSLNLSFNNLEGEVPCGGIFQNRSAVHLEGNPKLFSLLTCGNTRSRGKRLVIVWMITPITAITALILIIGSVLYLRRRKRKISIRTSDLEKERFHLISYEELRQATGSFREENLLGKGSFGSVFKGFLRDGTAAAIKVFDTAKTGSWKSFLAECDALRNTRHRNLVKVISSCSSMDNKNMEFVALIYEYLSNGSLDDWLKGKRMKENGDGLNIMERLNVVIDVSSAMDYLHNDCDVPVVHCDLKPSNILLDEDMSAKVGDFGLARMLMEKIGDQPSISSTHVLKGSIGYIPPEYGLGAKPSTAGDVYSFGVMLLELFTGKSPTHENFMGDQSLNGWVQANFPDNLKQVLDFELLPDMDNLIHDGRTKSPEAQSDSLITIFGVGLSCTVGSPEGRISIRDALNKLKVARSKLLASNRTKVARKQTSSTVNTH